MKKWGKRVGLILLILLAFVGFKQIFMRPLAFGKGLGVVEINGTIWVADDLLKEIESFRKNPNIVGVVVRINSPGGVVAASQEIFSSLKKLSQTKPVVASMGSIAASGGLYIALAANKIVADEGTLTGSIGVRMEHVNASELLKFLKVDLNTIKSGRFKDIGSYSRPMQPEERAILDDLMSEIHEQFKSVVAKERKLKLSDVETFADGRVFSGAKAKTYGIVDELGSFDKAVEIAAVLAKIKGEPRLVYADRDSVWWAKAFFENASEFFSGPQICFLYQ